MMRETHILLILTGGTIGTCQEEDGKRRLAGADGEPLLIRALKEREPGMPFRVTIRAPYQVLSEHMTLSHLSKLAECLRSEDLTKYDGVCITHGSDTLAYTAAFLGELMRGCPVPVFLLAAQRPISDPESNGVENTIAALKLIGRDKGRIGSSGSEGEVAFSSRVDAFGGNEAPVFIAYRNADGHMYLHRGEELRQCEPGTDDFFSRGMQRIDSCEWPGSGEKADLEDTDKEEGGIPGDWRVPELTLRPDVLLIHPYVGIRYDCISLTGIRAVLHTLYHSSTAPQELTGFLDRCGREGVKCYILPCDPGNYHYETTAELLEHGAIPVMGMSEESAFFKALFGRL